MIEVIALTVEDAKIIEEYGGDRIELVSALSEGGLTPSYGLIEAVVKAVDIPVNVMIRPHSNSFNYTFKEITLMKRDIEIARELGANGVVLGVLNDLNMINTDYLEKLLSNCDGLDVTFHKAIEHTKDIIKSAKLLNKFPQITTILTSGGIKKVHENLKTINKIIKEAENIDILVGGGLNFENIEQIKYNVNTSSFHFGTALRYDKSMNKAVSPKLMKKIVQSLH
ncbi:copper homeostasis protein CutC [Clostridiaceae bacterium M8S5]|nr:copper homeostasis protein CutC [Clostridiaceae bacterium M8S5]